MIPEIDDDLLQLADERLRPAARERLERLGREDAPALQAALDADRLGGVGQAEILRLLGQIAAPETLPAVVGALEDPRTNVRSAARTAVAAFSDPRATEALVRLLDDADRDTVKHAAGLLGTRRDEAAVAALVELLDDPEAGVRYSAARALADIGGAPARGALAAHLARETDPEIRRAIATSAGG